MARIAGEAVAGTLRAFSMARVAGAARISSAYVPVE
jgi:hypothetical protein